MCCGYSSGSRWSTSHPGSDQRQPSAARRSSSGVAFGRRSSRLVIESCTLCDSRLWLGRRGRLCVSYTRRRAWSTVHVVPIASHVDDVDVDCCTVCCSDTHEIHPAVVRLPCLSAFCCLTGGIGAHVLCAVERRSYAHLCVCPSVGLGQGPRCLRWVPRPKAVGRSRA